VFVEGHAADAGVCGGVEDEVFFVREVQERAVVDAGVVGEAAAEDVGVLHQPTWSKPMLGRGGV